MAIQRLSVLGLVALACSMAACASRTTVVTSTGATFGVSVGQPDARAAGPVDYGDPAAWLCLPDRSDACDVDLATTVIDADGTMRREEWRANPTPPIDCFYVYPTVSREPTPNSGIVPTEAERAVVASQFARFGSQCRRFAPMYRQMTLAGLRSNLGGAARPGEEAPLDLAFRDVRDAWRTYLERYNDGRGVVLIGHSQGSIMLLRLLREEIEGTARRALLVSAILAGWNVLVPEGRDVGGDLERIPLCRSRSQTGCVVTYVSFHEDSPPPDGALFGRSPAPGMRVACTNPAALGGGRAVMDSYFSANRAGLPPWTTPDRPIGTPYVRVPGMVHAECVSGASGSYLSIRVVDEGGARSTELGGRVMNPDGTPNAMWGLHLLDVPIAIGDLVVLVGDQARAYRARFR